MDNASSQHISGDQRLEWMKDYETLKSVPEVCKKHSISRKTFYKWLKRYRNAPDSTRTLDNRSRRPHHSPKATSEDIVRRLKELREKTGFGQRRLRLYMEIWYEKQLSESTVWKLLKRAGVDMNRKRTPIRKLSPRDPLWPGDKVTIAVKTMNTQIPHQRAVLYLAVDECSQLRIGKMYKRHSTLSALDFVQVLVDAFPFRIRHLQTPLDNVFTSSTKPRKGSHAFTHNLRHLGIIHLVPSQKAARIKQIIERVRKVDQESFLLQTYPSAEEAQNEIRKYLLRWNNERKIAPDENLAPVEKLRSFDQFEDFGLFDPKID